MLHDCGAVNGGALSLLPHFHCHGGNAMVAATNLAAANALGIESGRGITKRARMGRRGDLNGRELLAGLTDKQRQVLDLLIEHKTSKEIARLLEISPHTVDQRIQFAKEKLGAANRSEAAVVYRRLRETWDQMTYKDSGIAESESDEESDDGANAPVSSPPLQKHSRSDSLEPAGADFQVVQGVFEGRFGTLMRLGAIAVIAVCLLLLVLGALATLLQLSHLLRG